MSVKNPITYFDYWYSKQNEAQAAFNEIAEQELAPYVANIMSEIRLEGEIPAPLMNLIDAMSNPPHPSFSGAMAGFLTGTSSNVAQGFLGAALQAYQYKMAELFTSLRIDAPTACLLYGRKKITQDLFDGRMKSAGFKPAEALIAFESTMPYPSIMDLIRWAKFTGDPNNPKGSVYQRMEIDDDDFDLWNFLTIPRLDVNQLQQLWTRKLASETYITQYFAKLGYQQEDINVLKDLAYLMPDASTLIQAGLFENQSDENIIDSLIKAGVHPEHASKYLTALTSKPDVTTIIENLLRTDPQLSRLPQELERIGVNKNYFNMYRENAYVIPPVQDIITMAVREAFSPAIASRFGQYEDFPADFAKYAGMKGLSQDWAQRYWAAHWSLPSPQQGYEMLHRGIINIDDLNLLLKALDIMPFWRQKLIDMAYNVYTRVDVRRMYDLGVLTKEQVTKAYKEMGYNDEKAAQLTTFTVQQHLASISGLNSGNVVNAYSKGLVSAGEMNNILVDLGLKADEIQKIISAANYKKNWELKDLKIAAISNQYKKKQITKQEASNQLSALQIAGNETAMMLDKWEYAEKAEKVTLWTAAQTLSLYKKGLIDINRAKLELVDLGYNTERIDKLLAGSTPTA